MYVVSPGAPPPVWSDVSARRIGLSPGCRARAIASSNGTNGNVASATNKGLVSHPRAAALQGLEKMRHNLGLGLAQGVLLPQFVGTASDVADLVRRLEVAAAGTRLGLRLGRGVHLVP